MACLNVGLLWYDGDSKAPLAQRVEGAAARYAAKFGRRPNACYVHQKEIDKEIEWQGVRVMGAATVLPNHFWLGVAEEAKG